MRSSTAHTVISRLRPREPRLGQVDNHVSSREWMRRASPGVSLRPAVAQVLIRLQSKAHIHTYPSGCLPVPSASTITQKKLDGP